MFVTSGQRSVAFGAGIRSSALAVLVAFVCVAPLTAMAQTPVVKVLLSNEDNVGAQLQSVQVSDDVDIGSVAQQIRTGISTNGIIPRKLTLWFGEGTGSNLDISALSVAIWRNGTSGPLLDDRNPPQGTDPSLGKYFSFQPPDSLGGPGPKEFTYTGFSDLAGNWPYHIVVQYNKDAGEPPLSVDFASSSSATEYQDDWSVGSLRFGQNGDWSETSNANFRPLRLRFKLEGFRRNADATGNPAIALEPPVVGRALRSSIGDIEDRNVIPRFTRFSYQWRRADDAIGTNAEDITGADNSHYLPVAADLDKHLQVVMSFTDSDGYEESRSSDWTTAAVAAMPSQSELHTVYQGNPASAPVVTGDLMVGSTITIDVSTVIDPDGDPPRLTDGLEPFLYLYAVDAGYALPSSIGDLPTRVLHTIRFDDYTATYTLTDKEQDKLIIACWEYRQGSEQNWVCSRLYGPVQAFDGGHPMIGGTARIGEVLTTMRGTVDDADGASHIGDWSYQWKREDSGGGNQEDIPNERSRSYTLTADDFGKNVRVEVSFMDGGGGMETRTSEPYPYGDATVRSSLPAGIPALTGVFRVGETLGIDTTGITDTDGMSSPNWMYDFWMFSENAALSDVQLPIAPRADVWLYAGRGSSRTVKSAHDIGAVGERKIIGVATYTDDVGDTHSLLTGFSNPLAGPNAVATGKPEITGTARAGATLTAVTDPDVTTDDIADTDGIADPPGYTYQWQRETSTDNWEDISSATGSTYSLGADDGGRRVRVVVTFTDLLQTEESVTSDAFPATGMIDSNFIPTGAPVISGTAAEGLTLTAVPGTVDDPEGVNTQTYMYAWFRQDADGFNRSPSSIATGTSYRLVEADAGKRVLVVVSFMDNSSNAESLESAPHPANGVVTPNTDATGEPTITGTPVVEQTLTAAPGTIADAEGLTRPAYTYQWIRQDGDGSNPEEIPSATDVTYTLGSDDVGKKIVVRVSFADSHTNEESRDSLPFPQVGTIAANRPATGKPEINGVAKLGQILTVNTDAASISEAIEDQDGLTPPTTFNYVWQRQDIGGSNNEPIGGASGNTYELGSDDVGRQIVVVVSFTDDLGNEESLASDPFPSNGTVSINNPAAGMPAISGIAAVAETLTAAIEGIMDDDGLPAMDQFAYQWVREDSSGTQTEIAGAAASSYTLVQEDGGRKIRVMVDFTDLEGSAETVLSEPYPATGTVSAPPSGLPAVSGRVAVGETLTVDTTGIMDPNGLDNVTYSYLWQRVDADGANPVDLTTDATYVPVSADVRQRIRVTVTFSDDEGNSHTLTSGDSLPVNNLAAGTLTVSGTAQVGLVLTADPAGISDIDGIPTPPGYTYQWQRGEPGGTPNWMDIEDATATTYTMVKADEGKVLRVRVSFTDSEGNQETADSAPFPDSGSVQGLDSVPAIGAPTISGSPLVGETLTAETGGIRDPNGKPEVFSYQWQRLTAAGNWVDIAGATSSTYDQVAADENLRIRVVVSYSDNDGNSEKLTSAPYAPVSGAGNQLATGQPAVSGTATVGQNLTAGPGDIGDPDGLSPTVSYSYQWQRGLAVAPHGWTDIEGAIGRTYQLTVLDQSLKVRVKLAFADSEGNPEERASAVFPEGAATVAPGEGGASSRSAVTIADAAAITEPAAGATATMSFIASLAPVSAEPVTVEYSLGGTATEGVDYAQRQNKQFIIPRGTTTAQIPLEITGDSVAEGESEMVVVTLLRSTGASLGSRRRATGLIEEPDQVVISVTSPQISYSGEDDQTTVSFEITMDEDADVDGEVDWRVAAESPTAGAGAQVTCADGNVACVGAAQIAAGRRAPADPLTAVLSGRLPGGSTVTVYLKPFSVPAGSAITSAIAPVADVSAEMETIAGGWVAAGQHKVVSPRQTAVINAVAGYGRNVATSIVNGVWRRANAHRSGDVESRAMVGGRTLDTQALAGGDAERAAEEAASFLGFEMADPDYVAGDADRTASYGGGLDDYLAWAGVPDSDDLARRTSFALAIDHQGSEGGYAVWGDFGVASYSGETDNGSTVDSGATNMLFGVDRSISEDLMVGIAASRSSGDADYSEVQAGGDSRNGSVEMGLTSFAPYFHSIRPSGLNIWGTAGIGSGSLTHKDSDGSVETDLSMQLFAGGAQNEAWKLQIRDSDLSIKGDFFMVSMKADGKRTASGASVGSVSASASRLRLASEVVSGQTFDGNPNLRHQIEMGARLDSGDDASGLGVDFAAELNYSRPELGLSANAHAGTLLLHTDGGYQEWNMGVRANYDLGADGRGASLSLEPTWNVRRSGVADAMWEASDFGDHVPSASGESLRARLGYGVEAMRERSLVTYYGETQAGGGNSRLRVGGELRGRDGALGRLRLDLYGERTEGRSSYPDHAVMLEGGIGF